MNPANPKAHRTIAAWAVTSVLTLLCACRGERGTPVHIDLLAQFAETDSRQTVLDLDLGTPAAALQLGPGWSAAATAPTGESILWSSARKVVVQTRIREPHDRVLLVRCATLAPPDTRAQVVAVRVNGRRVATITVDRALHEHRVLLPARFQRRGGNQIAFGMRLGRGRNRLPVAYDTVRIVSPEGETGPVPAVVADHLMLPPPSTAEYFLRVPPLQPRLRAAVEPEGGTGRVQITAMTDARAEETIFSGGDTAKVDLDLARYANEIVRLRFTAIGGDAIRLYRPAVIGAQSAPDSPPRPAPTRPANVVLFLVDTLRADHLGCYGYARPTSPRIDAFARQGVLFTRTVAQSSWTRPAAASILTGLYPQAHGVMTLRDRLPINVPTLAELLQARGYRTAGFVTNVNVAPTWGFQRGFDLYRYFPEDSNRPRVHAGVDDIEPHVMEWLAQHEGKGPFFLYIHVTDPHAPYRPPQPFADRLADSSAPGLPNDVSSRLAILKRNPGQATAEDVRALVARYDGEIALVDAYFGRLLDALAQRGLEENTAVILTADHGEEFLDHGGFEHGRTLYNELLGIPLVLRAPQALPAGLRSTVLARQIDVAPTVLDLLDIEPPATLQGRSLRRSLQASDDGTEALTQTSLASRDLDGLVTGPWKIVQATGRAGETPEIYQTLEDPLEHHSRRDEHPVLVGYARQRLAAAAGHMTQQTPHSRAAIDPAILERLRALGYHP